MDDIERDPVDAGGDGETNSEPAATDDADTTPDGVDDTDGSDTS